MRGSNRTRAPGLDAVGEPEVGEQLERRVDGRQRDARHRPVHAREDLLGGAVPAELLRARAWTASRCGVTRTRSDLPLTRGAITGIGHVHRRQRARPPLPDRRLSTALTVAYVVVASSSIAIAYVRKRFLQV